jgi:hypothetical protein
MEKQNNNIPTGLYWQGKKTEVERIFLPSYCFHFQALLSTKNDLDCETVLFGYEGAKRFPLLVPQYPAMLLPSE